MSYNNITINLNYKDYNSKYIYYKEYNNKWL